jgi:hypothetical protein
MTAHITTDSGLVTVEGSVYKVPCLAGDESLRRGTVLLERRGSDLINARTGDTLVVSRTTTLTGWGDLDGEAVGCQFDAGAEQGGIGGPEVLIPSTVLAEVRRRMGL